MSDPRLTPEELERIAELRRRILERHPDADEVNALNAHIRSMLSPPPRTYTATERKEASRQALALLTAAHAEEHVLVSELVGIQGDNLPIVAATMAGFASGLLRSFDDECEGAAECWLGELGQSVEAMPEGGE